MPSFDYQAEILSHHLDHEILKNSPISLYHKSNYLIHDINWFENYGYQIASIDAADTATVAGFMQELQSILFGLDFDQKEISHTNLDAFSDNFSELVAGYLVKDVKGLLIVIKNIDQIYSLDQEFVTNLLQILAYSSHNFMLYGVRLITLISSLDAALKLSALTENVIINPKEFFKKHSLN